MGRKKIYRNVKEWKDEINKKGGVLIYHRVYKNEGCEKTCRIILKLIRRAQKVTPDKPRYLVLNIDGHRNEKGGFDHDMFDLQNIILDIFLKYLVEARVPLWHVRSKEKQNNNIPDHIEFVYEHDFLQKGGIKNG